MKIQICVYLVSNKDSQLLSLVKPVPESNAMRAEEVLLADRADPGPMFLAARMAMSCSPKTGRQKWPRDLDDFMEDRMEDSFSWMIRSAKICRFLFRL